MGMNDKLTAPADFDGPTRDRKCTDILFMLLIVLLWIAMTAVGVDSIKNGDIKKLLAPIDYEGNLCGWDEGYEDTPNLYYVNTVGSGICVESCPSSFDDSVYLCRYDRDESLSDTDALAAGYCNVQLESVEIVNYCVFTDSSEWDKVEQSDLATYLSRFVADIVTARDYVFGFGFGVAIAASFVYIGLLQIPFLVATLVWTCVIVVFIALVGLGYGLWSTANDWKDAGTKDDLAINGAFVFAVLSWVFAVLWACLFCFLAKRISLAIGIIKEAGRAIAAMPLIIFWPLVELTGLVLFMVAWVYYAAYTASLGDISTRTETSSGGYDLSYKVYDFSDNVQYRGWFLIFCLFWTLNFITAIGQIVISMAVSTWYFARRKRSVGSVTVLSSIAQTMVFHLGTAAFGALIVAIVEMIQAVLSYIQKKAKGSGNKLVECVACCCKCCFWCLENCLRFINKNAYVQTAIFSTNFCTSARKAFFLIARNIARVAAVSVLGGFVLNLMTVFVTIMTVALAYWLMESQIRSDLNSLVSPCIMVGVLAYYTSKMVTAVYGMAITTILQCFVADEELFPPSQQYADSHVRDWVDKHGAPPQARSDAGRSSMSASAYAYQ